MIKNPDKTRYNTENPLVSICVISYNSSAFVLETLESAKTQTYQNIELIVSDDGSTDNTVELCKNWLAQNKERFVRTELITVEKNTGTPTNCNRAIKAANGEWIKLIAADDILLENCIEDNVEQVNINSDIEILFSKVYRFKVKDGIKISLRDGVWLDWFFDSDARAQFRELLLENRIYLPPSSFILKELIEKLNYFDEEIKLIEDYPFWIKATQNGHKLYFMKKFTVNYRQHEAGISKGLSKNKYGLILPTIYKQEMVLKKYAYPYYITIYKLKRKYDHWLLGFFQNIKNTMFNRTILRIFTRYLNPFQYILFAHRHLISGNRYAVLIKQIRD